jgi:lipopolysaccharide assembly outer membrane protein LptD (OstA)
MSRLKINPAIALALATFLAAASPPPTSPPASPPMPARMPMHPASGNPSASPVPGGSAGAPAPAAQSGAAFDLGVWTVHASSVDADFKTGEFSTPNKVVMTRAGGDVTADKANGNYKKQLVYLVGNVVMHDSTGNYGGVSSAGGSQSSGPSTLTADKAQIDGAAKIYKATGNVHYVQADTVVNSDNGTLNDATHDLFLQGNVHITQGTRKIDAQSVLYNTITGKAHAEGDVTMQFPGQLHRTLATPRPIHLPKNPVITPVTPAP